jgi:hypothetical protein
MDFWGFNVLLTLIHHPKFRSRAILEQFLQGKEASYEAGNTVLYIAQFRAVLKKLGASAYVIFIETMLLMRSKTFSEFTQKHLRLRPLRERAGEKTLLTENPEWERNKPNK